ncbi:MAG: hypothetical protein Q8O60_04050, partial [Deltaproteobacteria bacterium]|nr:hypothetical protein [Deltaproteobacteria bacterium]
GVGKRYLNLIQNLFERWLVAGHMAFGFFKWMMMPVSVIVITLNAFSVLYQCKALFASYRISVHLHERFMGKDYSDFEYGGSSFADSEVYARKSFLE